MNITQPRHGKAADALSIPDNERRLISILESSLEYPNPVNRHARKLQRAAKHTTLLATSPAARELQTPPR